MDKKNTYYIIGAVVLIFGALFFFGSGSDDDEFQAAGSGDEDDYNSESPSIEDLKNDPNSILYEGDSEPSGPLGLEIVSPEGDKIMMGQARLFNAVISNRPNEGLCECNWIFYLNEYSEETVYMEQKTNCANGECKFTSHVDKQGQLRLAVDVKVTNYAGDVLGSASDERNYLVAIN